MSQNDIKVKDDALPYVIVVGDEYAAIWWDGEHWTHDPSKALHIIEWKEAKRLMSELRNSRLSTIRTDKQFGPEGQAYHRRPRIHNGCQQSYPHYQHPAKWRSCCGSRD